MSEYADAKPALPSLAGRCKAAGEVVEGAPEGTALEIDWLEDFLAVQECGGFSRAALARNVTQSALSRRIRALEEWIGTPLFVRTTHAVSLTPAGEIFHPTAEDTLRRLAAGRTEALAQAKEMTETLRFASTNALSWTFFPAWLRRVESDLPFRAGINLVANHMNACERIMLQGHCHFLLCHHHPAAMGSLSSKQFKSLHIGDDILIPVSVPAAANDLAPLHALSADEDKPVTYLNYTPESGMGRIIAAVHAAHPVKPLLKPSFSSHLAKLLVTMVVEGRGMAWLPKSLIEGDLQDRKLVPAGGAEWEIPIEIHIFRSKARLSSAAEQFWAHITKTGLDERKRL